MSDVAHPPGRPVRIIVRTPVGEHLYDLRHHERLRVHRVRKDHIKWSGFFSHQEAHEMATSAAALPNSSIEWTT